MFLSKIFSNVDDINLLLEVGQMSKHLRAAISRRCVWVRWSKINLSSTKFLLDPQLLSKLSKFVEFEEITFKREPAFSRGFEAILFAMDTCRIDCWKAKVINIITDKSRNVGSYYVTKSLIEKNKKSIVELHIDVIQR